MHNICEKLCMDSFLLWSTGLCVKYDPGEINAASGLITYKVAPCVSWQMAWAILVCMCTCVGIHALIVYAFVGDALQVNGTSAWLDRCCNGVPIWSVSSS